MADTIVLIHGFWTTPRVWEHWVPRYEAQGYRVLAPGVDEAERVVAELDAPPILVGHCGGGAVVQVLLDRGYGAAGVTLSSAPTAGVSRAPLSQLRAIFPALKNPARRARDFALGAGHFASVAVNGEGEERARELHARYAVPESGTRLWDVLLGDGWAVDYGGGSPLLFVAGRRDHVIPPSIQRANAALYTGAEVVEVDGPHLLPVCDGWEAVADLALSWAESHLGEIEVGSFAC